jgi:hypothetical protein
VRHDAEQDRAAHGTQQPVHRNRVAPLRAREPPSDAGVAGQRAPTSPEAPSGFADLRESRITRPAPPTTAW